MASSSLRKIKGLEFARRLKASLEQPDTGYAFFLGAGCSISSGIPAAGTLVRQVWLPALKRLRDPAASDLDTWAKSEYLDYDPTNPAALYGQVMGDLFFQPEERQREIERLCDHRSPGFGYAVLAALVAQHQGHFNVVLTTNFDDLVADALYLFTNARPLVIQHEALATYIRASRTRPLVVKLHGDLRITPQNTDPETSKLKVEIDKQVRGLLQDRGLVFVGYGGHDNGITEMLADLPQNALPLGVYWVSNKLPEGEMAKWLKDREACWVELQDFDELMLLVQDSMGLQHPDQKRFEKIFANYAETYKKLSEKIETLPDSAPETAALKDAVARTDKTFTNDYGAYLEANRLEKDDPNQAEEVYRNGIEQFPNSANLIGQYAIFLKNVRRDYDRAEELYTRAIGTDPDNNSGILGNYAFFLHDIRKDYANAEELYTQAIAIDPKNADNLGNYAFFLNSIRKDGNRAEVLYKQAITADPNYANGRGNYAGFLLARGQMESGLDHLSKALANPDMAETPNLAIDHWFTAFIHRPPSDRIEALHTIKLLLCNGARCRDSYPDSNIERASKDGHPESEWLPKLAAVIKDEADISILNNWPAWNSV